MLTRKSSQAGDNQADPQKPFAMDDLISALTSQSHIPAELGKPHLHFCVDVCVLR